MLPWIQEPNCGYTLKYNVTIELAGPSQNSPSPYHELEEGDIGDPSIIEYSPFSNSFYFSSTYDPYLFRDFYVHIYGQATLSKRPYTALQEVYSLPTPYNVLADWVEIWPLLDFEGEVYEYKLPVFKVSVQEPLYLINNSPPEFQEFPEVVTVMTGQKIEYNLPATTDYENNTVYL